MFVFLPKEKETKYKTMQRTIISQRNKLSWYFIFTWKNKMNKTEEARPYEKRRKMPT